MAPSSSSPLLRRFLEVMGPLIDGVIIVSSPQAKVNAKVCCKVVKDKIVHWMKNKAARGEYVFEQDLYQAHVAKKTVNLLKVSEVQFWVKHLWLSEILMF